MNNNEVTSILCDTFIDPQKFFESLCKKEYKLIGKDLERSLEYLYTNGLICNIINHIRSVG